LFLLPYRVSCLLPLGSLTSLVLGLIYTRLNNHSEIGIRFSADCGLPPQTDPTARA
jgi:hypothetical protein